jgi:hypothetical protein
MRERMVRGRGVYHHGLRRRDRRQRGEQRPYENRT